MQFKVVYYKCRGLPQAAIIGSSRKAWYVVDMKDVYPSFKLLEKGRGWFAVPDHVTSYGIPPELFFNGDKP